MSEEKEKEKEKDQEKSKEDGKSFWQTLPGIITAITSLIVAVTGLITVLTDNDIIGEKEDTPTPFITVTPVDIDEVIPTPVSVTPEPEPAALDLPACRDYEVYQGKANPNAVILAFTEDAFWVRYGGLEEEIEKTPAVTTYLFSSSSQPAAACLRQWVKYLGQDRTPSWPSASDGKGRANHEVWLSHSSPAIIGELASWQALPDNLLVAVYDQENKPDYVRIYQCGQDFPEADRPRSVYWHAGTSQEALEDYLDLYAGNNFTVLDALPCNQ